MTYAILALFVALFIFPPVYRGRAAKSSPIGVWKPQGPVNPDGSVTQYAHVQEVGEYRLSKLAAIAAGVPFLFIEGPVVLLLMPIAMCVADQAMRFAPWTDWAGHNAEIMAAEADGAFDYRNGEILRMSDDRDKQNVNIAAMLLRWEWLGRIVYVLGRF